MKRQQAGTPGNFNYTFDYRCNNGKTGRLVVTTANDNEAHTLAVKEAQERCGE